ncbi:MAG TPA: hypothetical protein PKE21_13745 [Flavobacteriales bacterium]|nr:hypothetical protein [Flavobacteriales bacterium]HMR28540.1 hypothetical protein [Flavobacteriales bacterium]
MKKIRILVFTTWLVLRTALVQLPVPRQPVGRQHEVRRIPHAQQQPPHP